MPTSHRRRPGWLGPARPTGRRPAVSRRTERGTGLLASAAGVGAFLLFLLFAVQLLVNLYAVTTVSAAGFDAARTVASRQVDHDDSAAVAAAQARAESRFRALLGRAADRAELSWTVSADAVQLHVIATPPGILPTTLGRQVAFGHIDRTFVVRVEELR